jgi:phosphate transport system substrate-binding protein
MKKIGLITLAIALFLSMFAAGAQAASRTGNLTITGSSALLPLMLQAKKEFNKANPRVKIAVSGISSIVGPQAVKRGTAQIGTCDWDSSVDVPGFKKFPGQVANKVAAIPFAFVTHKDNPVTNLTKQQLIAIYRGQITNWSEVGGNNAPIVVNNRAFGSGTRVNIIAKAFDGATGLLSSGTNYVERSSTGAMKTGVESNVNAIGYMDLVYVSGNVKAISFNGVAPTPANVINKSYPIWAFGYMMTQGQPTGTTKAFIDYVQSKKFQNGSVKSLKFIPIAAIK